VVNSGCANACNGEQGLANAFEVAKTVGEKMGIPEDEVLVASTGIIGAPLPMNRIKKGIKQIVLSAEGGHQLAKAIMTTDTMPKEIAIKVKINDGEFTIGGAAKGSGMIHPDLATLLCFLTTDAAVDAYFLKKALKKAAAVSFNMVSIDGDTSPSDTMLIMANGLAKNKLIKADSKQVEAFQSALNQVCIYLAKCIARDGEGATKLIEVRVNGARSAIEAKMAARTVTSSPLVKTAVYGSDPNWGRIIAAVGRSGAEIIESKADLYIDDICLLKDGRQLPFNQEAIISALNKTAVPIILNLNLGKATAIAWGCDLSPEYININSLYMT
jgi:glutamate N-acetyltransferase/amino-acid N-acetyltransferase